MSKIKRFLTEQEDRMLSELRSLQDGNITQETVDIAVGAVKELHGIDTAFYNRGEQSIDEFMSVTFGCQSADEFGEEPAQSILIDFN